MVTSTQQTKKLQVYPHEIMQRHLYMAFYMVLAPAKIGAIVGGSEAQGGRKLINKFLKATPALKKLREAVAAAVKKNGHLKGIDGRILPFAQNMLHSIHFFKCWCCAL